MSSNRREASIGSDQYPIGCLLGVPKVQIYVGNPFRFKISVLRVFVKLLNKLVFGCVNIKQVRVCTTRRPSWVLTEGFGILVTQVLWSPGDWRTATVYFAQHRRERCYVAPRTDDLSCHDSFRQLS